MTAPDITPNHPAVEALADAIYRALSSQYGDFGTPSKGEAYAALTAALPHLTADDLRATPAGQALMAEAWSKFQEHYAAEWEEAYPEDIFPSPAPPPAVVSRESVAASMMRKWAKNLRSDHNPFEEDDQ